MAENIPIKNVGGVGQYIGLLKKHIALTQKMIELIERIEEGDIGPGDPSLQSLKHALDDLKKELDDMRN